MKHIHTILFFPFFSFALFSQNDPVLPSFPFPGENPVWHIQQNGVLKTITVGSDTTLCGNTWTPATATSEQNGQAISEPLGFYRIAGQAGKKVYYRETLSCASPEFLMYDFDVEVGDTVYGAINKSGIIEETTLEVRLIFPFEINGHTYRNIFLFEIYGEAPTFLQWTEVPGSIFHPFYLTMCPSDGNCDDGSILHCLSASEGVRFVGFPHPDVDCVLPEQNLSRLYVNKHVEGGLQNGRDWPNAFSDLQDAIAIADPGDTIWVAQGTYLPTESANREIFFEMKPEVVILGGFNATETAHEQRDWEAYPTILSGDIGIPDDSTDNSYHVLYTIGTDSTSRLDGFTVAYGQGIHADPNYLGHFNGGGGLFVNTNTTYPIAYPVIVNCVFLGNISKNGGAVYLKEGANPLFRNCTFRLNRSTLLGGALNKEGTASQAHPFLMEDCVFEQNRARGEGGGLALNNACENHKLLRCTFRGNYAMSDGAGIYYFSNCPEGEIKIEECLFEGNDAASGGGISYAQGFTSSSGEYQKFSIIRSIFINNNARTSDGGGVNAGILSEPAFFLDIDNCSFQNNTSLLPGGALYFITDASSSSNLTIKNSIFKENRSTVEEGTGGAIMVSGFFNQAYNNILIANALFLKNSGALRLDTGDGILDASLRNCTFYDNGRRPFVKYWSPDFNASYFLAMRFENCVIWEPNKPLNRLFTNGANVVLNGYSFRNSLLPVADCNLPGGIEACAENNLFNLYPQFLDTLAGDFRLAACSPAINAGAYSGLDTLGILDDLDGALRVQEGIEDMGAFERPAFALSVSGAQAVTCPGAMDGTVIFETTGNFPLSYFWENDLDSDTTVTMLAAGDYLFTVTDATGCSDVVYINIPPADTIRAVFNIQNASALNVADGRIALSSIEGGAPPYIFEWGFGVTGDTLLNLLPGTYMVTVSDSLNCRIGQVLEVSAPNANQEAQYVGNHFRLWPNPSTAFTVLFNDNLPLGDHNTGVVKLYNVLGVEVFREQLQVVEEKVRQKLDLSSLASGVYFCVVTFGGVRGPKGGEWIGEFIKQ